MAHLFKEKSMCPFCFHYLERPVYLECGCVCCLRCLDSLEKSPEGDDGVLCPRCSVVSLKEDILRARDIGDAVAEIKNLEPVLSLILTMNPAIKTFQGKTSSNISKPIRPSGESDVPTSPCSILNTWLKPGTRNSILPKAQQLSIPQA